jgi:ABC-type nickel/cobalt efflux system permease component RcnA
MHASHVNASVFKPGALVCTTVLVCIPLSDHKHTYTLTHTHAYAQAHTHRCTHIYTHAHKHIHTPGPAGSSAAVRRGACLGAPTPSQACTHNE